MQGDRLGAAEDKVGAAILAQLLRADLLPVSREIVTGCLALIDALAVTIDRLDIQCVPAPRPARGSRR